MLIKRLKLEKLLSFNDTTVELGPLNVLIGANAAGKSNLIEVIGLLKAAPGAPTDLANALRRGGGIRQWLWLGDKVASPIAKIECDLILPNREDPAPVRYLLHFSEDRSGFTILNESVGRVAGTDTPEYFTRSRELLDFGLPGDAPTAISSTESVLSRYKYPGDATPVTELGKQFERINIFREFQTGQKSQARWGISASVTTDTLWDGADNLALVLHELDFLGVHDRIREYAGRFCERFEDVKTRVGDGVAQIFLRETGLVEMLSALRMSDGTLKFLALLAVLFHPLAPPLMCIEEPELGLHPDALQLVAEALIEASERTQLIVTTHSEALINALSDRPEAVLVCERGFDNGTQFKRLDAGDLKDWLEHYSLDQLWRKGEIGGGRW